MDPGIQVGSGHGSGYTGRIWTWIRVYRSDLKMVLNNLGSGYQKGRISAIVRTPTDLSAKTLLKSVSIVLFSHYLLTLVMIKLKYLITFCMIRYW